MTKSKITYVSAITTAINVLSEVEGVDPAVIEKLEALKTSVEKRNSRKSDKPTKAQRENEAVKADILDTIADGEAHQCKDVAATLGISGQKCSALLNQMVDAGTVTKFTEKRVTYFKIAG